MNLGRARTPDPASSLRSCAPESRMWFLRASALESVGAVLVRSRGVLGECSHTSVAVGPSVTAGNIGRGRNTRISTRECVDGVSLLSQRDDIPTKGSAPRYTGFLIQLYGLSRTHSYRADITQTQSLNEQPPQSQPQQGHAQLVSDKLARFIQHAIHAAGYTLH